MNKYSQIEGTLLRKGKIIIIKIIHLVRVQLNQLNPWVRKTWVRLYLAQEGGFVFFFNYIEWHIVYNQNRWLRIIFITMHHNNSEVLAFKKFFIPNTSVRATLNLKPDQDVKKNLSHLAHPLPKNKSISITNNKNVQSFSTSALPYYNPAELVNNC